MAIVDVTNGARLETYTIAGERGSGVIGINGPAAHLMHENDIVILITYAADDHRRSQGLHPKVVHVDKDNKIVQLGNDPAEGHTAGLMRPPFALNNASLQLSPAGRPELTQGTAARIARSLPQAHPSANKSD